MTDVDAKAIVGAREGAGARADLGMGTARATAAGASATPASGAQRFEQQGFLSLPALLDADELAALAPPLAALARLGGRQAGTRALMAQPWCRALAARLQALPAVAACIPADYRAVQCTLFEKSRRRNWGVAWHQDGSVPVPPPPAGRAISGLSRKEGRWFAQPPASVLAPLVALRLHLDVCGDDDGPLQVVPGSHRLGRLDAAAATALARQGGAVACPSPPGGALLLRPLLLHASGRACGLSRRRVLHWLYAPPEGPWAVS